MQGLPNQKQKVAFLVANSSFVIPQPYEKERQFHFFCFSYETLATLKEKKGRFEAALCPSLQSPGRLLMNVEMFLRMVAILPSDALDERDTHTKKELPVGESVMTLEGKFIEGRIKETCISAAFLSYKSGSYCCF